MLGDTAIAITATSLLILMIFLLIKFFDNPLTEEETNNLYNRRFQKNINNYRVDLPISKEDPFKSSKYSSQKILKARERIAAIKKYWKENKEKLKEMPFMTDELFESTDKELNN